VRALGEKSIGEAGLVGPMLAVRLVTSGAMAEPRKPTEGAEAVALGSMTLARYCVEELEARLRFLRTPLAVKCLAEAREVRARAAVAQVAQDTSGLLCFQFDLAP
jgi:hypothetical protein